MKTRREIEKEIIVRIFQTANVLQTFLDNDLEAIDLTTKQFYLMLMMSTFEYNPTISEVSQVLGSSRQNCMQLALKLEKNGYIKVEKDKLDARSKRLYFTEKANEFWNERDKTEDSTINKLFAYINSPDLSTTNHILNRIFEAVNNYEDRDDEY